LRDVIEPAEMNVGRGSFRRSRFNTTGNKSLSMETQNCNELARCCLRSNQKHVSRRFIPANFLEARQVSIQRYFAHITPRSIVFSAPLFAIHAPFFRIRTTNEGRPRSAAPTKCKIQFAAVNYAERNSQPSKTKNSQSPFSSAATPAAPSPILKVPRIDPSLARSFVRLLPKKFETKTNSP